MEEIMSKVIKVDGTTQRLVNSQKDNCLICEQPLKDSFFSWNIFHGEVSSSCCGAPYQTKDFGVDASKKEAYKKYFAELNKPSIMSLSVAEDWIEPLKQAMKELGATELSNEVREKAKAIHDNKMEFET
jgi:hypothetical protein